MVKIAVSHFKNVIKVRDFNAASHAFAAAGKLI
jgi:hypothetical protein